MSMARKGDRIVDGSGKPRRYAPLIFVVNVNPSPQILLFRF
jgi:hypothetical protein